MHAIPSPSTVNASDRLALTVFVALAIHVLVILGVTFVPHEHGHREHRSLDVVLVHERSPDPPEEARYFAEADQRGGDESLPPAAPSPPPAPRSNAAQATIVAVPAPLPDPAGTQAPLPAAPAEPATGREGRAARSDPALSQTRVPRAHKADPAPPQRGGGSDLARIEDLAPPPASPPSAATLRARAMKDLSAEIDQRLKAYAQWPRRKWITARTREHAYAAYMEAWRQKVERIGNLNYPEEARRRGLSGSLSLDVALNADGSVAELILRRSSGEKALDEAALRIVELAAPFARFPPSILKEVDVLHIERTWQFSSRNRFTSR